jgi:hypothetical protein
MLPGAYESRSGVQQDKSGHATSAPDELEPSLSLESGGSYQRDHSVAFEGGLSNKSFGLPFFIRRILDAEVPLSAHDCEIVTANHRTDP